MIPVVAAAVAVYGFLHLDRSAAALRSELMAATGGGWHAQVQLTVSPPLVAAVRSGLAFVHDVPAEAHEVLRILRSASVGVYQRRIRDEGFQLQPGFWAAADRAMVRRGWTRVACVVEHDSVVLVYVPVGRSASRPSQACVAVCDGRRLVVVTAGFHPGDLGRFLARQIDDRLDQGQWKRGTI